MTGSLQQGLAVASGTKPPACWRLVLLDFVQGVSSHAAGAAVGGVLDMLEALRRGEVQDLAGATEEQRVASCEQFASLEVWLATGGGSSTGIGTTRS